jgi:cation diffusion facilitator CzcD-associated flavoprotein CzcO
VYHDPSAKWEVHVKNTTTGRIEIELADVVINGQGFLNRPKYPKEIGDIDKFAGKILHTARWDNTYDTVGKTVAVIGAGSSGLQVVGAIGPFVKQLHHFLRTPSWIVPHFAPLTFSPGEREQFKDKKFHFDYY